MTREEAESAVVTAALILLVLGAAASAARAWLKDMRRRKACRAWRAACAWKEDEDGGV